MKKELFIAIMMFMILSNVVAQVQVEPSFGGGVGYISDQSGDGNYEYVNAGLALKREKHLIGGFVGFTNVAVVFGGYHFTAKEYTIGPSLVGWGKVSRNYTYAFWLLPGLKIFRDYGHDAAWKQEAWQNDVGTYILAGANLTDSLNRWFHSYKAQLQYQDNFWSKRTGQWNTDGNIGDLVNYKAVNKAYFKFQLEAAAKRFPVGRASRLEPKIVVGYLSDGGSSQSYLEYGGGLALSFMKNNRYYEPCNLQYRARFGDDFSQHLNVWEFNLNLMDAYYLLK